MEVADRRAEPAPTKRRIALFLDGTWNVEDSNTNVWRLYSLAQAASPDAAEQICFYTKGVGTDYGSKLKGGVLGWGFTAIIREVYEWLIAHYRKGDDIFIFGFSRGSYAARSLAGLIARCGVPTIGSPIGVEEIYGRYQRGSDAPTIRDLIRAHDEGKAEGFSLFETWMVKHCITADIAMVGVWDTVGSLIGRYDYLETGLRLPIRAIYHAIAIDEHRVNFKPSLLTRNIHADEAVELRSRPRPIENVEQRWFAGAHANIGGGYASDPLCQRPLTWIATKSQRHGLQIMGEIELDEKPWFYPVANSFRQFAYHLYQALTLFIPYYRKIGAPDKIKGTITTENVNETIDASVFERWRMNAGYRPNNLKRWAKTHGVDPAAITSAVLTKEPTKAAPAD